MAFDIQEARKAGYNNKEIEDFLSKYSPSSDVKGALANGYSLEEISSEILSKAKQPQPLTTRFDEFKKLGGQPTEQPATEAPAEPLLSRFDKFKSNVLGTTGKLIGATGEMAKGLLPNVSRETTPVNIPFVGERELPIVRPQLLRTQQVMAYPSEKVAEYGKKAVGTVLDVNTKAYDMLLKKIVGDEAYSKLDQSVLYHFAKEAPKAVAETAIDLTAPFLDPSNLVLGSIIAGAGAGIIKRIPGLEKALKLTKIVEEKIPAQTFTLTRENVEQIFKTVEGNPEASKFFKAIPDANNIVKQIIKTGDDVTITLPETIATRISTNPTWARIKKIIGLPETAAPYSAKTVGGIKIAGKEVAPTPVTPSKPLALTQRFDEFKKAAVSKQVAEVTTTPSAEISKPIATTAAKELEPLIAGQGTQPSGVSPITKVEAPKVETPKTLTTRFEDFKKNKPALELPPSDEIPKNKIEIPEEGIWYSTKVISRRLLNNEALKKYGKQGEEIFSKIKKAEHEATYDKSKAITELSDTMKGLQEKDYINFGDYIEGKKTIPVDAKIAVNKAKAIFKDIANKAKREGLQIRTSSGEKIPFIPRENYYPYYVKEDVLKEIFKDQSKYTDFLEKVAKENNTTIAKAHELIQKMVAERGSINGHLERARLARLPIEMYERDPRKILSNYISGAYDRVSIAKEIGGDDQILNKLIEKARVEGKDFEEIALLVNRALGREKFNDKIKAISSFARMYNNITKLSLVAITNIGDIVKPLVRTNFKSTIKALVQSATKEGKHRAALAGVDKNSLSEYAREQGLGNKFFTYTGFEKTESMLRIISANAAKNYVNMLYRKLKKNPENVFVKRRLEQFGLNPNELYARGIREKDYIDASIQAIADTQPVSKLDMPYYWQSPTGKMLAQYKTFAYKQYDFMKKFVFSEAAKGNIKPLLLFLVGGAAVGEGVADLKAFVRGRDRDSTMGRRIIDNLMTIGGIGLATDFLANLQYGTFGGGLLKFITGPSLSDLDAWVTAISGDIGTLIAKDKEFAQISKLTKKSQRQIKVLKKALYSMPFAGPYLANKLFPTRNKYRARTIPIAEEVLQMFGDSGKSSSGARRW